MQIQNRFTWVLAFALMPLLGSSAFATPVDSEREQVEAVRAAKSTLSKSAQVDSSLDFSLKFNPGEESNPNWAAMPAPSVSHPVRKPASFQLLSTDERYRSMQELWRTQQFNNGPSCTINRCR